MAEDWQRVISRLAQRVATRQLTQEEIAQATGVDQSQVSRILAGRARRRSRNVEKLCRYALAMGAPSPTVSGRHDIEQAMSTLWDGSARHARALAEVLGSMARMQRVFSERGKKR
jgi:transcriptional regulator with XRE-family HTH domain